MCFIRSKKSKNIGLYNFCSKVKKELAKGSQVYGLMSSWRGMLNTVLQEIFFDNELENEVECVIRLLII